MKTTIEMHGFEIVIEETEAGLLTVSAMKDGDVVEEFSLEAGEDQGFEGEDDGIKGFDQFGEGEEEDFEGEESDDDDMEDMGDDDDDDMEDMGDDDDDVEDVEDEEEYEGEEEDDSKLESFQSFINSKKRK